MPSDPSFDALMDRLRAGDAAAATRLFEEYAGRLTALARSRLAAALRGKVDAEDVMQSVFKSFFLLHAARPFDLDSRDSLWGLLARLTVCKCARKAEHFRAAR